jgi:hypothetical protein
MPIAVAVPVDTFKNLSSTAPYPTAQLPHLSIIQPRKCGMAKNNSRKVKQKAVKKFDKAVRKAIKKGIPVEVLEHTVDVAMERIAVKKRPAAKRGNAQTSRKPARGKPLSSSRPSAEDAD